MAEEDYNASCPRCGKRYYLTEYGNYECSDCKSMFYFPETNFELPRTAYVTKHNCPYCHGEIPVSASKCKHCGEWINKNAEKSRFTYLLLTFLFGSFGVGEFYAGKFVGGFILLAISIAAIKYDARALLFPYGMSILNALCSDVGKCTKTNTMAYAIIAISVLSFIGMIYMFIIVSRL